MNRRDSHMTMGLGIPSLLVIFVVLGMTILSVLAYLQEESNSKIVDREIEYAKSYYLADAKAKARLFSDSKIIDEKSIIDINQIHELFFVVEDGKVAEYRLMDKED